MDVYLVDKNMILKSYEEGSRWGDEGVARGGMDDRRIEHTRNAIEAISLGEESIIINTHF